MTGVKVKICGQTRVDDCALSLDYGADYLGVVVNVDWSARSLTAEEALPIFQRFGDKTFLLTFDAKPDDDYAQMVERLRPSALQLTGNETSATVAAVSGATGAPVYKSIHLRPEGEEGDDLAALLARMKEYAEKGAAGFVLDTAAKGMFGGTGVKNDWATAAKVVAAIDLPVFIAGGINPGNVAEAAAIPGVYGVDLASGVEVAKGQKSEELIRELFLKLGKGERR